MSENRSIHRLLRLRGSYLFLFCSATSQFLKLLLEALNLPLAHLADGDDQKRYDCSHNHENSGGNFHPPAQRQRTKYLGWDGMHRDLLVNHGDIVRHESFDTLGDEVLDLQLTERRGLTAVLEQYGSCGLRLL